MRREVYFLEAPERHIAHWEERIAFLRSEPRAANEPLYQAMLYRLIAAYSNGESLEELSEELDAVLDAAMEWKSGTRLAEPVDYWTSLWLLSLCLLTGKEAGRIGAVATQLNWTGQDALIDRLLAVVDPDLEPIGTLLHLNTCFPLMQTFGATAEDAQRYTASYLRHWYTGQQGTPWYDSHLSQQAGFFGYWSFEVAAVVKALSITDAPFADHIFYPRDLVHQRLFRTWMDGAEGEHDRSHIQEELEQEALDAATAELGRYFMRQMGGKGDSEQEAMEILTKLSGMPAHQLEAEPEMAQAMVVQLMRSLLGASGNLQKILEENGDSEALQEFIAQVKAKEGEWDGNKAEIQEILDAMPEEAREAFEQANGKPTAEFLTEKYDGLTDRVSELLEKEKVDQLSFVEGLERLAADFGHALGADPRPVIRENVAGEVRDKLRKQREGRTLSDFDWSSLAPQPDQD